MDNLKTAKELNDMLASNGWLVVDKYFTEELKKLNDLSAIDDTQPLDKQAIQIKANKEAHRIISNIVEGLKKMARVREIKKKKLI